MTPSGSAVWLDETVSDCSFIGNAFSSIIPTKFTLPSGQSNNHIAGNPGFNPVGTNWPTAPPALSTVGGGNPYTNNLGTGATVFVAVPVGGTPVLNIDIGGVATGTTVSPGEVVNVRVPAGQKIRVHFGSAPPSPTWQWFGD